MSKAFWSTTLHFQGCFPFNESENFQCQLEHWKAFQGICWECIHLFLFFSPRALQMSSCCPSLYVSVTIHIPIPSSHTSEDTSDAPGAIATEAPEGTYILPVTEHKKQENSPAVNLIINLRLLMDLGILSTPFNFECKQLRCTSSILGYKPTEADCLETYIENAFLFFFYRITTLSLTL